MKLLIITQKVDRDDDWLGFFHRWLEEFAKHCEKLTVVALAVGFYDLPANVTVKSLGKPAPRFLYLSRLFKYLWQSKNDYDRVFVHMNPIYIVLAGWWWKITGKKIALWYTHRQVDWSLRIAEKFADVIFTAAAESFRWPSRKLKIVGHGIDLSQFKPEFRKTNDIFTIIHVGRLTPIKNCDTLIKAAARLKDQNHLLQLVFIGGTATAKDRDYEDYLKKLVIEKKLIGQVEFVGSVPNREIAAWYGRADLSVNLTPTGGIDKAVLESMAAGTVVLSSNQAFINYFGPYSDQLLFNERDDAQLADRIQNLMAIDRTEIAAYLTAVAAKTAGVENLIRKIFSLWP